MQRANGISQSRRKRLASHTSADGVRSDPPVERAVTRVEGSASDASSLLLCCICIRLIGWFHLGWGDDIIECDFESKWGWFDFDPASSVVLGHLTTGLNPTGGAGLEEVRVGEGECKDTGREEKQNKKVIALVRTNLIYATSIVEVRLWSAVKARVHFLVTVVG